MPKVSIEQFRAWVAGATEDQVLCAKAKLLAEATVAEKMIEACNIQLDYWDKYNFNDITRLAKSLEIEPPQASD